MRTTILAVLFLSLSGLDAVAQESSPRYGGGPPPAEISDPPPATVPRKNVDAAPQVESDAPPRRLGEDATAAPTERTLAPVPGGNESEASELIRKLMTPPVGTAVIGRPISLHEALIAKEYLQPRHLEIVRSYWRLSFALGDYYQAIRHRTTMAAVAGADRLASDAALRAAAASERAQIRLAHAAVVHAQHDLAERLGLSAQASLPTPADLPLTSPYRTYYETIFENQPVATSERRRAARIHQSLPLNQLAIEALADSALEAERYWDETAKSYRAGSSHSETLLKAYDALKQQQRLFLEAVQQRNQSIAEYAWLVADDGMAPGDMLPMLLKVAERPLGPQPFQQPALGDGAQSAVEQPFAPPTFSPIIPATAVEPIEGPAKPPGIFVPPSDARPLRSVLAPSGP